MWLVQADKDIGPVPCFIRAGAEEPVCARYEAAPSRLATDRGLGAGSAHARRRGIGTVPAPAPGAATPSRGYLPVCKPGWLRAKGQAGLAESKGKGKGPGLRLRTENLPAGNEIGFRCLLGARVPSQAQPPSSRFRVAVPLSRLALCQSGAVTSGGGRLDATPPPGAGQIITGQLPSGRPAPCWTVCRNLPRIRAMSTPEIVTVRISDKGLPARITDL